MEQMRERLLLRGIGAREIGDVAGELIGDHIVKDMARALVGKQCAGFFKEGSILLKKSAVKKLAAADGDVGSKQRILCGKPADLRHYVVKRGSEREQDDEILVFFLDFPKGEYALAMKAVAPHKAFGGEKIGYGDPFFRKDGENFIRAVSHAVDDNWPADGL